MRQTESVRNGSGVCYFWTHQISVVCAGVCTCHCSHSHGEDCIMTRYEPVTPLLSNLHIYAEK